jgi:2-acylglycerol O-acyltransferase 2
MEAVNEIVNRAGRAASDSMDSISGAAKAAIDAISPVRGKRKSLKNRTVTYDSSNHQRTIADYWTAWYWMGHMFSVPFLMTTGMLTYYFVSKVYGTMIIAPLVISFLWTTNPKMQPEFIKKYSVNQVRGIGTFLRFKVVVEDMAKLKMFNQGIFALEPHDVLPTHIMSMHQVLESVPGYKTTGCVSSACFVIPIMKHVYSWMGAISVDKKDLTRFIKDGGSPVFCPGGVAEATLLKDDKECAIFLKKRLGFVKMALQNGIPLIPSFGFGLRGCYDYVLPKSKLLEKFGRFIGFMPMLIFGMWGLPFGPPKPCAQTIIIGDPIPVEKMDNPSEEVLKKYHAMYIAALTDIFERNKEECGMGHVTLKIV